MFFVLVAITDDTLQEQFESFYVHVFISDTAVAVTNDLEDGHHRRREGERTAVHNRLGVDKVVVLH